MERIFQVLKTYRKQILIVFTILFVAILTGLILWGINAINQQVSECEAKGGVLIRNTCVDKSVVIP